jgi:hypothetical protein
MSGKTAKVLMSFIDQVRIAAAHDTTCELDQNPVQREYEVCLSKLSDEERGELVRIINKLSQHLDAEAGPNNYRHHQPNSIIGDASPVLMALPES